MENVTAVRMMGLSIHNMHINIHGPINDLGYGQTTLNVVKSLAQAGHFVAYFQIGYPANSFQHEDVLIHRAYENQHGYDPSAPSITIWHQNNLATHIGRGPHCAFPIFELDGFTGRERNHMASVDKLFVCSQWAKQVVVANRILPEGKVVVAPLGVDRSIFYESEPNNRSKVVFLNVGKWEVRKGHDILIDAWKAAFNGSNDVELWMMNHNPFLNEHQEREWLNLYNEPNIRILPRVRTHQEVADIMRLAHVGVFPSRAEGWNLEALEMLSCGRQIIITDYSAHTEFCNSTNSLLVPITEKESSYDGFWFDGSVGNWAKIGKPSFNMLVEQLRKSLDAAMILNSAGVKTAEKYSWAATSACITGAFEV